MAGSGTLALEPVSSRLQLFRVPESAAARSEMDSVQVPCASSPLKVESGFGTIEAWLLSKDPVNGEIPSLRFVGLGRQKPY